MQKKSKLIKIRTPKHWLENSVFKTCEISIYGTFVYSKIKRKKIIEIYDNTPGKEKCI